MIVLVHLVCAHLLYPDPITRSKLRRRLVALTAQGKPTIVVAGDSRGLFGVDPRVLTRALGRSERDGINIAISSGDSTSALAAFREFRSRFAAAPVVILSVSSFSVGGRGAYSDTANAQYYWSADWHTRIDNLSAMGVAMSGLSSERMLGRQVRESLRQADKPADTRRRGFFSVSEDPSSADMGYTDTIETMMRTGWFRVGQRGSAPWRRLRADIAAFQEFGATVVVLDAPIHPVLRERLRGTERGRNYQVFESTLLGLCRDLQVPLLRYKVHDLGESLDGLFADGLHLTQLGAEALSALIARDLARLEASGAIAMSEPLLACADSDPQGPQ